MCQIINKERSNKNKVIEEASTTKVVVPFAMKILTIKMQLLTVKSTVGQIFTPIV
jgi:galactose-1-phosphate uridylyltransferase